MCAEDRKSQEHLIVENCRQAENARACINNWIEVILEMFDNAKERRAEPTVDLLHAENIELIAIRVTLKNVYACFLFVYETCNESLQRKEFWKASLTIERESAASVSNVYKTNVLGVLKNQVEMYTSAATSSCVHTQNVWSILQKRHISQRWRVGLKLKALQRCATSVLKYWQYRLPKSIVGFVQIFSNESTSLQKALDLLAFLVRAVLVNFSDAYLK